MNTFDIIILITVILIIMILFTININSVLDGKLSNVEINIPPINIPDPQITVKIQRECGSENFDVYVDKPNNKTQHTVVSLSPIGEREHFGSEKVKSEITSEIIQKFSSEVKLQKESSQEEIPKQEKHVKFAENISQKIHSENAKTCNKSLNDQRKNAYQYLITNNSQADTLPICGSAEYHDIISGDSDDDLSEYHRQYEHYIKSYLEDPIMRGYNIGEYNVNASLDQIGNIKLTKDYKNPKPSGYIFNSSPIYEK